MRVVVAVGGNALLRRGQRAESDIQAGHVQGAAEVLAPLVAEHELVITHGNGPQVGLLAQESEQDPTLRMPYPFDVLGAQTQGVIGYWLVQALYAAGRPRAWSAEPWCARTTRHSTIRPSSSAGL